MRKIFLISVIAMLSTSTFAQDIKIACERFNHFNNEVLKSGIKKEEAVKQFQQLIACVKQGLLTASEVRPEKSTWRFPLQGYNYRAIGGTNGNGYADRGYRYLDGNKHLAHPAHDIFINDKNQDCLDDHTNQPVNVVSIDFGVVIACTNEWDSKSDLRGGKFIWIYHPTLNIFTYYAHNGVILVKPGDQVKRGQKIAEVGRTGYNAFKKRSPTHLHFSAFHLVNDLPVPYNCYVQLKTASKS